MRSALLGLAFAIVPLWTQGAVLKVGENQFLHRVKTAIVQAKPYDTVMVFSGFYKEGNLLINKPLTILGMRSVS